MKYEDSLAIKMAKNLSKLDMSYYDDPNSYNQNMQMHRCKSAVLDSYNALLDITFGIVSFIIALVITIRFSIVITLVSIVAAIPGMLIQRKMKLKHHNIDKEKIKDVRYSEYLLSIFYHPGCEKELQLYNFGDYIVDKIEKAQSNVRNTKISQSIERAKKESILLFLNKAFYIAQQLIMVSTIIAKRLSIGDFSYYGGIVRNLSSSVSGIFNSINNVYLSNIKYDEYSDIVSRQPRIDTGGSRPISIEEVESIVFDNVSFHYLNSENNVLRNVSIEFIKGHKYALVGINGAGKSTLIKLLLRFYDPTEGRILLNGIDVREYDLSEYRRLFSTMFQEPLIYSLTVEENISISDMTIQGDHKYNRTLDILADLNFQIVDNEEIDIERLCGREFDSNGYVFSKGQQQRIHAAKTLFRASSFYIMDEPAASMDAISETLFVNALMSRTQSAAVIYITHRYHNLDLMDDIIVLQEGEVVETGDHYSLIQNKGLYARLFELQKE